MSVLHQDPDSVTTPTHETTRVRHGYHPCQFDEAIQTARCGYQRLGEDFRGRPATPPPNACVVCIDMRNSPCPFCGVRG